MNPAFNGDTAHIEVPQGGSERLGIWKKLKGVMTFSFRVLSRPWHRIHASYLITRGDISFLRFQELGEMDDLEVAITLYRRSLEHFSPSQTHRSRSLSNLANAILIRFEQTGMVGDLEEAIAFGRQSLDFHPPGHPHRSLSLTNLANSVLTRFEQTGNMEDLEEAIALYRESLDLCPLGHSHHSASLINLSNAILSRFEQLGNVEDLEEAIECCRQSLNICPPGHPHRSGSLTNLANAILARFNKSGKTEDLEEAIIFYRQSLDLRPRNHPDHPASLNNLANAILERFQQTGRTEDLEEVITFHQQSLELHPHGHPERSASLSNLSNAILKRFERTGEVGDLEEAITLYRQSLDLRPLGHPDRAASLSNLSNAILTRFEQMGKMGDLEEAIGYCRQSLALHPPVHTHYSTSLTNLANAILTRFEQAGEMEDLEEAIAFLRQALDLRPPGHPHHATSLSNLANAILTRFDQTGKTGDLKEAITFYRESLNLCHSDHPHHSTMLINFSNAILKRFQQRGEMEDLEEAIEYCRQSLDLCHPGHPHRPASLTNLSNSILARFEQTGKMEDLEEAIEYYRQSLDLHSLDHPNRSLSLGNLANGILTRFEQTENMEDLEEAITLYRQSLDLRPLGHPDRSSSLSNLSNAIRTRFDETEQIEDLQEAIDYCRQSLDLRPVGHPDRSASLINLANGVLTRFEQMGQIDDLHEAARYLSDAETSLPANHPTHAQIWSHLASVCLEQYKLDPSEEQLSKAFALYQTSANHHTASIRSRFAVARKWAFAAEHHKHESTLRAHSTSLTLLDRYLVTTPTVESQRKFLASTATIPKSLASDAASSAIKAGRLDTAVEFLERGRVMILSKMRKYRPLLEELRAVDQELADEFAILSTQLERNAMSFESERTIGGTAVSLETQQQKHRILSEKWEEVVGKIRMVTGFSGFLQTIPFATLRTAAAEGPVVVVNISQHRSDAIIVRDAEPPVVVHLPDASPNVLSRLSSTFSDPRVSIAPDFSKKLGPILKTLWDTTVRPVTEKLVALGVVRKTRIWWCPTSYLCALPLHAAGPYLRGQRCLPELYISSYTSTLSALIAARSGIVPRTTAPNLLVIGDTGLPGTHIPNVEEELRRIQQLGDFVKVLVGEEANRDQVISGLQQNSWAHFSCHGHRNPEPFHSSFQLYAGERLELLDLMRARLPNAEHAFLSACHAAAADIQGAPDEVLHLAGALQFCGFRSVVGTMWAMQDIDGPDVAEDFYRYMFREPGCVGDLRDSATALNLATMAMRRRKGMTLNRWVNFIHIGA